MNVALEQIVIFYYIIPTFFINLANKFLKSVQMTAGPMTDFTMFCLSNNPNPSDIMCKMKENREKQQQKNLKTNNKPKTYMITPLSD